MLVALPACVAADIIFQSIWLPFGRYGGSILHWQLLKDLRSASVILIVSDIFAAVLVVGFLGVTGSTLVDTLQSNFGGLAWVTWLVIGLPCAWIGGQVIPVSAVARVLGDSASSSSSSAPIRAVLEQPGTMRKAALGAAGKSFATYGAALKSAEWLSLETEILEMAGADSRGIARLLIQSIKDLPHGEPGLVEVTRVTENLRLMVRDVDTTNEVIIQAIRAVIQEADLADLTAPLKSAVWASRMSVAI